MEKSEEDLTISDIINLTILECKFAKMDSERYSNNNNKSNHIGM